MCLRWWDEARIRDRARRLHRGDDEHGDLTDGTAAGHHVGDADLGPFGTSITIAGNDFGATQSFVDFDDTPSVLPGTGSELYIDQWSNTEVVGRVAFPSSGAMTMHTGGGMASVGTFTSDMPWLPGPGLGVSTLVTSRVLSTGTIAAIYSQLDNSEGAALAVFGGGSATAYELDNVIDPTAQDPDMNVRIVEADDHSPELIATQRDGTVVAITISGGALVTTPTGITGQVWAADRDATGVFAWIDSGGMVRARPGAPWTTDRGPFQPAFQPLDGAVAADGTLWISMNKPNLDPLDIEGYVALQSLGSDDTQLSAVELADPNSYDDVISQAHIVLADDGVHMVVVAFTRDNGTGQESYVPVAQRTAPGTWSAVALPSDILATPTFAQYHYVGTTLGVAVADPSTMIATMIPDLTAPSEQQLPVWPATPDALVDIAGRLQPIVNIGGGAYVPAQP
ncbi:MAG TPA: hypothetical protein VH143_14695 [Kofleriaceae bacterium]|nr:hypothetical protein [Kofleriaceae bacterium]